MIILLKSTKNFFKVSLPLVDDKAPPIKIAKKITCNISPFTKESKGLFGIIFNKISKNDGGLETFILFVSKLVSISLPGWNKFAKNREIDIAKKVVVIYIIIDLMPILPRELIFWRFATPLIKEKKTMGTTSILINLRKMSPPNESNNTIVSSYNEGIEIIPNNKPKIIPDTKPINIFSVKLFFIMVPSTGYAPVAESYQDPVLLLN